MSILPPLRMSFPMSMCVPHTTPLLVSPHFPPLLPLPISSVLRIPLKLFHRHHLRIVQIHMALHLVLHDRLPTTLNFTDGEHRAFAPRGVIWRGGARAFGVGGGEGIGAGSRGGGGGGWGRFGMERGNVFLDDTGVGVMEVAEGTFNLVGVGSGVGHPGGCYHCHDGNGRGPG